VLLDYRKTRDEHTRKLLALAVVCFGAVVISLVIHELAYLFLHLLMPRNRTALFIAPLCTLAIGAIAAVEVRSEESRFFRGALLTALALTAVYFLMCLRLNYFREWQYQEDVKRAYDVVAWYNHNRNVQNAEASWRYCGAMKFYQELSGRETLNLSNSGNNTHPPDKQHYVLDQAFERAFIDEHQLKIMYRGPHTDLVIVLPPDAPSTR